MTRSRPFSAPAGTVLFRPGTACPGLLDLGQGRIRVSLTAPNGREVVLYRVLPGDMCLQTFACLTTGVDYSAEGVAETDLQGAMLLPAEFRRALAEDMPFRDRVLASVARRFAEYETLVEDVALTGLDTRLARALLKLDAETSETDTLSITHEALAAETASGRAVVSRRLAAFAADGLVATGRGTITLCDRAGLRRMAEDPG